MREGMNIFFVFAHYFRCKSFHPRVDYENPFKYIWRVYKCWGFKEFVRDQFYKPAYKDGFRYLKEWITGKPVRG